MKEFMQVAIEAAQRAEELGEVPVGAVIVKNGQVLAITHNEVEIKKDPTAHAEILVLRAAGSILNTPLLTMCDVYVTLEPCAMCTYALILSRVRRLYFGAYDEKRGAIVNGPRLLSSSVCLHSLEVYEGIMEVETSKLLKLFFKNLRHNKKTSSP